MISKEFRCDSCRRDFESLMPICTQCGGPARRVFLSAPRISTGVARRTDKILETNFKRMGISNFSNAGGVNRVTWISTGSTSSTVHGQPQAPVQPTFNSSDLGRYGINPGNMTVAGQPYQLPDPSKIPPMRLPEVGTRVGAFPSGLRERTNVQGRTDERGNVTELNGSDGK